MFATAMAVLMFSNICVRFTRMWRGGNMRVSGVVNTENYCWRNTRIRSAPETTYVAIVRPSLQAQLEPANVKTMVSDTAAPVAPMNPIQSSALTFWSAETSSAP